MNKKYLVILSVILLQGCNTPPVATNTIATNTVSPSPAEIPSPIPAQSPLPAVDVVPSPTPTSSPAIIPSPSPSSTAAIIDANGYTVLNPSADSKVVYVAMSGLDTNSGLTTALPVKTLAKGISLLRNGFPDWLLLRRGDKFVNQNLISKNGSWMLSGRSASEPMVISSYSDPKGPSNLRPELATGELPGWGTWGVNHLALMGIYFHASTRDPYSPDFAFPNGVTTGHTGLGLGGNNSDILIEDCMVNSYAQNISFDAIGDKLYSDSNIRLRRNIIKNAFSNNRSQGLYMGAIHGVLIEGNIFNHNGWTEMTAKTKTWNFMAQNHNLYMREDNTDVIVRNNLFASGADFGAEIRGGGMVTNNLFVRNNAGIAFGLVNGASGLKGGVSGEVSGNVVLDGRTDSDIGGFCIELGNILKGSIHDNICARETNDVKGYGQAFVLDIGNAVTNPADEVGLQQVRIENNLVYSWATGLYVNSSFIPGGSGQKAIQNLIVRNNDFQMITKKVVDWESSIALPFVTLSGNAYFGTLPSKDAQFEGPTVQKVGWANWVSLAEPTAKYVQVSYPDAAHATVESYFNGTFDQFMADEELLSKFTYKSSRVPYNIMPYLKAKFGK